MDNNTRYLSDAGFMIPVDMCTRIPGTNKYYSAEVMEVYTRFNREPALWASSKAIRVTVDILKMLTDNNILEWIYSQVRYLKLTVSQIEYLRDMYLIVNGKTTVTLAGREQVLTVPTQQRRVTWDRVRGEAPRCESPPTRFYDQVKSVLSNPGDGVSGVQGLRELLYFMVLSFGELNTVSDQANSVMYPR